MDIDEFIIDDSERLSPAVVVATAALIGVFLLGFLYRIALFLL
jgi:hypothetical protein